ncbi:TnsD family Tn7-like transposition protein [Serpentinicella alkaliphila]|nr:TnsD family Tn7-like transposition protein [Serpentinicella alkaliphila]QUH25552.1 TniQ family protein [Serpentinicella alkaliphila]
MNKIPINFYQDEILYSVLARYHHRSGNVDNRDTIEEAFGTRNLVPTIYFPTHLNHLASRTFLSSDELIEKHTLFPLYSCFLPEKRKLEILMFMKGSSKSSIYTKIGTVAGSICTKTGLYYCPLCVKESLYEYGEGYFRRGHQIQGVFICHIHNCVLYQYSQTYSNESRLSFIRLDEKKINYEVKFYEDGKLFEDIAMIANNAQYLLDCNLSNVNQNIIYNKYMQFIRNRNLLSGNGTVYQSDLYYEFSKFYSNDLLNILESNINIESESNWLKMLTRKPKRVTHPVRHILLINFLSRNFSLFFSKKIQSYKPFGNGPWPCLNVACSYYKKLVINNCKVTIDYKTKSPVGTFECECGFIYSRMGSDVNKDDIYKIGRIKYFGNVWNDKLKSLTLENRSVREIARLMNCDSKTVIKYSKLNSIIEEKRIKEKTKLDPATKSKEEKKRKNVNLSINNRVDWGSRDNEIIDMLKSTYIKLLNKEPMVRITRSLLGKTILKSALIYYYLDKLPITRNYIDEITETTEEFQIRRVDNICEKLGSDGEILKKWKIVRIANLRSNYSNKVEERIRYNIDKYNNYLKF